MTLYEEVEEDTKIHSYLSISFILHLEFKEKTNSETEKISEHQCVIEKIALLMKYKNILRICLH